MCFPSPPTLKPNIIQNINELFCDNSAIFVSIYCAVTQREAQEPPK